VRGKSVITELWIEGAWGPGITHHRICRCAAAKNVNRCLHPPPWRIFPFRKITWQAASPLSTLVPISFEPCALLRFERQHSPWGLRPSDRHDPAYQFRLQELTCPHFLYHCE